MGFGLNVESWTLGVERLLSSRCRFLRRCCVLPALCVGTRSACPTTEFDARYTAAVSFGSSMVPLNFGGSSSIPKLAE